MTRALPDRRSGGPEGARRGPSSGNARTTESVEAATRAELTEFLDRFAQAFASGDLEAIAACHVAPVLFVTEWDSTTFGSPREIAEGFREIVAEHQRRGLVSLSHRVETLSSPASRIVEVGVQWTFHNADGRPLLHDRYRYLLRRIGDEGLFINAVMGLGGSPVRAA
jgi:hypothetical protein